ncbi:MAG: phosphoethanolamine transferase domain-containing protein, partial [Paramuribaculum sp.]|nr:phosphoethanolamine transferase domain-containing protein [Paramuribaculum sp.]
MKHSDQHIQSKPQMAAALLIWVLAACLVPNIWLSLTEPLTFVQIVTNILLPAGVYAILMSLSRHIGRTSLWMITVMFFAAFQIVLLYMYGRSIIAVDMFLNVATTNPDEVGELLGNMFPIIGAIVIIYVTPIAASVVAVVGKWRLSQQTKMTTRRCGTVATLCGLIFFGCSFFSSRNYSPLTDLYPVNVLYNVGLAVDRTKRLASYAETSAAFRFDARATHTDSVPEIYIAVIGETSRADNWQLFGYHRQTTPELTGRDNLVGFGKAISQSNTTHKSVPMLLSSLDASDFGDSIYTSRSFIT